MADRRERDLERQAAAGDPEAAERVRLAALRRAIREHYARIDVRCSEGGLKHMVSMTKLVVATCWDCGGTQVRAHLAERYPGAAPSLIGEWIGSGGERFGEPGPLAPR